MKTKRQKNKSGGASYSLSAENHLVTRSKADKYGPLLVVSIPGWHGVRITRHEAACILWDAWRKGRGGA